MSIPQSPPRRYTTSRQMIAGDDVNAISDHSFSFQTLTPVGATQALAVAGGALVNAANVEIPAGAPAAGVVLPVSYPGTEVAFINNSANTTTVYPNGAVDVIQNGATGYAAAAAGITIATGVSALLYCVKKGFWQVTKAGGP